MPKRVAPPPKPMRVAKSSGTMKTIEVPISREVQCHANLVCSNWASIIDGDLNVKRKASYFLFS